MNAPQICWRRSLWQLPPSCRRAMSQAAAAASRQPPSSRRGGLFEVPRLWNEESYEYAHYNGVHDRSDEKNNKKRLYSAKGFQLAYSSYQQKMLDSLNQRIAERGIEGQIKDIAIQSARNPAEAALFNHASMAFNNHFFFSGIATKPDVEMPTKLKQTLEKDFGSIETLKAEMLAMADAMFGPGFVWLVRTEHNDTQAARFKLLATYLAGSPLAGAHNRRQPIDMNTQNVATAQSAGGVGALSRSRYSDQHTIPQNTVGSFGDLARKDARATSYGGVHVTPCLCVSTWEHTYMFDWKYQKRQFLERWWTFVNWDRVQQISGVDIDKNQTPKYHRAPANYGARA